MLELAKPSSLWRLWRKKYKAVEQASGLDRYMEANGTSKTGKHFRPIWTSRTVFICLIICLLVVFAGLEVILYLSDQHQGLATGIEDQYYYYKYGPTAGKPW